MVHLNLSPAKTAHKTAHALYRDPQLLGILCLSFSSGLPFLLTLGTLQTWLKEVGVSNTALGAFAFATMPYALKFLWAPWVDTVPLPFLTRSLGQRRSWILVSQALLALALAGLGMTDPAQHLGLTGMMAFVVCFCAATQDNGIDAYRIDLLRAERMGAGAAASIIGFRVGMWLSGGGAMYLATYMPWSWVYATMGGLIALGMIATLLVEEPPASAMPGIKSACTKSLWRAAMQTLGQAQPWGLLVAFLVCFKVGDTVLNMMSIPFLLELGFSKMEIAYVAKSFGMAAMIAGGALGGTLLQRHPLRWNMLVSLGLLVLSCAAFSWQAYRGHHMGWLIVTMGIENLACGMSAAALMTFISGLCQPPFLATHFALLSSCSAISRILLSALSGWMADQLAWHSFFLLVAIGCVPALVLAWRAPRLFEAPRQQD